MAREIGPTYLQVFCPCPTNYKFRPEEVQNRIKEREKDGTYVTREYITPEAQELLNRLEEGTV